MELELVYRLSKNAQTTNLMKIRLVGAELFHADRCTDGQTDRHDKANSHFRNISNALKIICVETRNGVKNVSFFYIKS
jgi:hypothetical protein